MRIILAISLFFATLSAEVQQVTLIWQPGLCAAPCVKELTKQLYKIPGVAQVNINESIGRAFIVWKPDAFFAFQPLNAAARYVGIRVDQIHLKVKGRIGMESGQVRLISSGDNTAFTLLNPLVPTARQYTVQWNPSTRKLSPELQAELLETQKNNWTVTIEGTFYEPYRSPPNLLIVEQLSVDKSQK